jgi:acyl-CoA thioester hydrolase
MSKGSRHVAQPQDLGCSVTFRVRYYETDMMGIVHHSNYLRWFEVGRTEYLRRIGMPYRSLEEMGLGCPVLGARLNYYKPSRYDDEITVQCWTRAYDGLRLTMAYQVHDGGQVICEGETDHAFVWNGRPAAVQRCLPDVHARLAAACGKDSPTGGAPGSDGLGPVPD